MNDSAMGLILSGIPATPIISDEYICDKTVRAPEIAQPIINELADMFPTPSIDLAPYACEIMETVPTDSAVASIISVQYS